MVIKRINKMKKEVHNLIQELDGLEIVRAEKAPHTPQCVDELEIQREYDMLLVKPTWNSLQIQGSGLNLLAIPRDMGLENQEIDEFEILGKDKRLPSMQSVDKFTIIRTKKPEKIQVLIPVPANSIKKGERFGFKGIKKQPEIKYIERFIKENKEVIPNEIAFIERFNIIKSIVKEDYVPLKRKGFVEKINKKVITKKEEKKEEIKEEKKPEPKPLEIENIESLEINKEYDTPKPVVLEKIDWNKMTKPIKSTKLLIKAIPHIEKEKEELIIENFAFNLAETKIIKELIIVENGAIFIEGSKGMILKEGPAQTIQIKKEQILLPSKNERFDLITEIKKPELILANESRLQIKGQYKVKSDPEQKVKIIEKIIEKKINWNEFNVISHSDLNIIQKKPKINLINQKTTTIALIGKEMPKPQKKKDWNDLLKVQSFSKFGLLGKPKQSKKLKLLVANGDKFFIQKESDDEIIYNDDYNTRKQKQKTEKKEKVEIIKEKEIIPRHQREIRAQIARVKESESETSSLSEIDVLAGIRNRSVIGLGGAEQELLRLNGYETKILNGEVVFTSKNGLGIDLGGSQYQKQFRNKISYSKKLSSSLSTNKMTGIEINLNPRIKTGGVRFEKMSATSGIIGEGNYKIFGAKKIETENNGQSYKRQIFTTNLGNNDINGQSNIVVTSRLTGQKSASNILLKKRGSNKSNETPVSDNINNEQNKQMKIGKVVFNSKKSDKGQFSPNSTGNMSGHNVIINSRREYEKRIVMTGDRNDTEKILNDKKKNVEIKFKKSKVKNVEPLRDYQ